MSLKIYLSQSNFRVGDIQNNCKLILEELDKANIAGADLALFSEMALTGYPCEDLWLKKDFLDEASLVIDKVASATKSSRCAILMGAPHNDRGKIYNAAFLIAGGEVKKILHKKSLPNYGVFDEKRYFTAENFLSYFDFLGKSFALLICEDMWDAKNLYLLQEQNFDYVLAINASPYSVNKHEARIAIAKKITTQLRKPLIYVNQVGGQDSLVFDGSSFVMNHDGKITLQMQGFVEDSALIELGENNVYTNVYTKNSTTQNTLEQQYLSYSHDMSRAPHYGDPHSKTNFDIDDLKFCYSACVLGLRDYVHKNNFNKVILGMSGGIDSALVAAICADAIGANNVKLYALPSRFNAESSMIDAKNCAANIGVEIAVISIESAFSTMISTLYDYCGDIHNSSAANLARENLQSRIRGQILMTISNCTESLLITTGNKSELATGYATLYGDMCGAFNPIKDLYKTQIYELAKWRNENFPIISINQKIALIPQSIIIKEPTAELRDNQKDSDSLPPYEILDKILFALIEEKKSIAEIAKSGFAQNLVEKIARMLYNSEYKRRQSAIGVKISDMSFDRDRRYPITNRF